MKAEIISIGDEVLIGQIVNTNAAYLSQRLTALGITVEQVTVVGDDLAAIQTALRTAVARAQILLVTGGLGPTHDDITKKAVAQYFQTQLVFNPTVFENISRIFGEMGRTVDARNREQALVPANAQILENRIGTAPGLLFETQQNWIFILPGVPMEMKIIFEDHIAALVTRINPEQVIEMVTIRTTGIFESNLFNLVQDLVAQVEPQIKVAFLPGVSGVNIRLLTSGQNRVACRQLLEAARIQFVACFESFVYGYDDVEMEQVIAAQLKQRQETLAVIDFFTTGALNAKLGAIPDQSGWFKGGLVMPPMTGAATLSALPGPKSIRSDSPEAESALLLADWVRQHFQADWGIAILPGADSNTTTMQVNFGVTCRRRRKFATITYRKIRTDIQGRAAQMALNLLRLELKINHFK